MSEKIGAAEEAVPGFDGIGRDSIAEAAHQLAFLEEGLSSMDDSPRSAALMDEAYRAAHLVKASIEESQMPQVARIARAIQELVRTTRAGRIALSPGLGALLRGAARAARESLEARSKGGPESSAAASAAAAMEDFLAEAGSGGSAPFERAAPQPAGLGRARFARLEERRVREAAAAAHALKAAAGVFSSVSAQASEVLEGQRAHAQRLRALSAELLDAIPRGLASAAKGEPATAIAHDLADRIKTAFGGAANKEESSLTSFAVRVRDAADNGSRTAAAVENTLARVWEVRLSSVLEGISRVIQSAAHALGHGVLIEMKLGDAEIEASLAAPLRSTVVQCIRLLLSGRPRAAGKGTGAFTDPNPIKFLMAAHEGEGRISLRLACVGNPMPARRLTELVAPVHARIARRGWKLRSQGKGGARVSLALELPLAVNAGSGAASFMLVRVNGDLLAIPSSRVVECVPPPARGQTYTAGGETLRVLPLGDPLRAGGAVVVRTAGRSVVALVDALEGEETLSAPAGGTGGVSERTIAGERVDGTRIRLVDMTALTGSLTSSRKGRAARIRRSGR